MQVRVWVLASYLVLSLFTPVFGQGNPDLNELKKNIETLQKDIQNKKNTQKDIAQTLKETKSALQKNEQELAKLNTQQQQKWKELQDLRNQLAKLSTNIQSKKTQLARLLNSQYKTQQSEALVLLLKNSDPNQKGRDLSYIRYMTQANQSIIASLREQQTQLATQETEINARLKEMDQILAAKQKNLKVIKTSNTDAVKEHEKISQDITRQNNKLSELKGNERRLASVIHSISKKPVAPVKVAPPKKIEPIVANPVEKVPEPPVQATEPPPEKPVIATATDTFSQQRGAFKLPTNGKIAAKFGSIRSEGSTWKGIVIEAPQGQGVQSIAAGKVAYASFLQGYGNTVIIDHGSNYLSIYTGLSNISVSAGNQVNARANLGSTGQLESGETGLYFEIRYLSQPMNPLSWAN